MHKIKTSLKMSFLISILQADNTFSHERKEKHVIKPVNYIARSIYEQALKDGVTRGFSLMSTDYNNEIPFTAYVLNADISLFENSVGSDQLASKKPADQNLHIYQFSLKLHAIHWNPAN